MRPADCVLHGVPYERASLYGMPHIGALYRGKAARLEDGAPCTCCGAPASNAHHMAPKGMAGGGGVFALRTKWGTFALRSPLMAVCGSGCTGCHGKFPPQGFELDVRWAWDDEESERLWWSGWMLAHGMAPHSPDLYLLGRYEILRLGEVVREVRG